MSNDSRRDFLAKAFVGHAECGGLMVLTEAIIDGDGTLRDHLLLIYGAGMSDSNAHDQTNLPLMLVGGPEQQIKGGRHLKYAGDSSANLLVTLMDKIGAPVDSVGSGHAKLDIDRVI